MKRLLFAMTLFASATLFADFAKYIEMTVNYTPTAAVDGFPVLVRLNSSRISYADVKNAGADLKFTDASGETVYPHEVDTWNASGESLVWVRLPELAKGAKFRMYYGDATVTTSPSSTPVWQGYDLVCHVSGNANDSATPTRAGALNPEGKAATGMIGGAYGMTAGDRGAAMINDLYYDDTTGTLPDGVFSYSLWIRANSALVAWKTIVGPRNGADTDIWGVRTYNPATTLEARTAKDNNYLQAANCGVGVGEWHKIDVSMNGADVSFYFDGALISSKTLGASAKRGWVKSMGWGGACGSGAFNASESPAVDVDECRIFSTVSSAARVAADYATVKNANFLSYQAPRDNTGDPGSVLVLH